jgi:hypothetical protein
LLTLAVAALALGGCSLLGSRHSGETIALTADEVVAALAEDRFETDYGGATLLVSGTVVSAAGAGFETIVTLATSTGSPVLCDLGRTIPSVYPADRAVVRASEVERVDVGVVLWDCQIVDRRQPSPAP